MTSASKNLQVTKRYIFRYRRHYGEFTLVASPLRGPKFSLLGNCRKQPDKK
jgi:hypothetical protein